MSIRSWRLYGKIFGIAFIPRTDILDEATGVSIHQIEGVELFHQIFMFWMKDRYRLPAVDRFITYMKEQAETRTDSENAFEMLPERYC